MNVIKIQLKGRSIASNDFFLFVWVLFFIFCIFVAFSKEIILPAYFFSDADTIDLFMGLSDGFVKGDSFYSTAYFYKILFISRDSWFFVFISASMIFFTYLKAISIKGFSISVLEFVLLLFFIFSSLVYMTTLSKDFVVFLITAIVLFTSKNVKLSIFLFLVLGSFYAYYFRTYWFLFLIQFVFLYILQIKYRSNALLMLGVFVSLFCLSVLFHVVFGLNLDSFRFDVNQVRLDHGVEDARTMILPVFGSGGFLSSWVNVVYTFVALLIPFPLVFLFSLYYFIIFVFVSALFFRVFVALKDNHNNGARDPRIVFFSSILFSFLSIQSIFEPDYGSYLRHLSPFMPMVFYIISPRSIKYDC